jgi:hypothetical protein
MQLFVVEILLMSTQSFESKKFDTRRIYSISKTNAVFTGRITAEIKEEGGGPESLGWPDSAHHHRAAREAFLV